MNDIEISDQKTKVFQRQPQVELIEACGLENGILSHSKKDKLYFIDFFKKSNPSCTFFIPASGSGSRMFKFLFDYLENKASSIDIELFQKHLTEFAFYNSFSSTTQRKIKENNLSLLEISRLILEQELGFSSLPKGLIPFHKVDGKVLNAFQSNYLQFSQLKEQSVNFHFTINEVFKDQILSSLNELNITDEQLKNIALSYQESSTDSYAFDEDGELSHDFSGKPLKRPSGHGALLKNLNTIHDELILIKNIDNTQHIDKSENAITNFQYLSGLLLKFRNECVELLNSRDFKSDLIKLNRKYQLFFSEDEIDNLDDFQIEKFLNKPIRVCGMVKNEGQPGGGPFWVKSNNSISKQIVEMVEISEDPNQAEILNKSQFFNPVIMVLSTVNLRGQKIELNDFIDFNRYLVVEKTQNGRVIRYLEQPGLWNGGMANWLTIFVEVPSSTFTPVKSILDLRNEGHISAR